jgi:hypothetical protein
MVDYFQYYNNERHHSSLNYKTTSKFYPNQATSVENHVLMNTNAYLLTKKKEPEMELKKEKEGLCSNRNSFILIILVYCPKDWGMINTSEST